MAGSGWRGWLASLGFSFHSASSIVFIPLPRPRPSSPLLFSVGGEGRWEEEGRGVGAGG